MIPPGAQLNPNQHVMVVYKAVINADDASLTFTAQTTNAIPRSLYDETRHDSDAQVRLAARLERESIDLLFDPRRGKYPRVLTCRECGQSNAGRMATGNKLTHHGRITADDDATVPRFDVTVNIMVPACSDACLLQAQQRCYQFCETNGLGNESGRRACSYCNEYESERLTHLQCSRCKVAH